MNESASDFHKRLQNIDASLKNIENATNNLRQILEPMTSKDCKEHENLDKLVEELGKQISKIESEQKSVNTSLDDMVTVINSSIVTGVSNLIRYLIVIIVSEPYCFVKP